MDLRNADMRAPGAVETVVEVLGGLAIVTGGALAAAWASDRFASPTSEVAVGLVVAVAGVGLGWIRRFDSNVEPARSSSLAGLGGAVGFLAFEFLVGEYAALGAGLGAGLFAAAGVLRVRRSPSRAE